MSRAAVLVALALVTSTHPARAGDRELDRLRAEFADRTGARLVFDEAELPAGDWYDGMPSLDPARQRAAARILVAEAAKYPRGWLGAIGLRTVGVFDALVSSRNDGYHTFDRARGGYLYYGMWNGANAIAAAYYGDGQLPLTFHHEAFHHVDGTSAGVTSHDRFFTDDDARLTAALDGDPYPALVLDRADLRALGARASDTLDTAVGAYSAKSAGEDQAETARWLMSHLADGLVQAATRPDLAGSQRILHVLDGYRRAGRDGDGPDAAWLVDVALGRDPAARRFARLADAAIAARVARIAPSACATRGGRRTCAERNLRDYVVWGREDAGGGNATLRADITQFALVGQALALRGRQLGVDGRVVAQAQARLAAVLSGYRTYIAGRWKISAGTDRVFATALASLGVAPPARPDPARQNPYLANVDRVIDDAAWRARIRAVQPATVKLGGGSGVNLAPDGLILTAGHVVDAVGTELTVRFPDGSSYAGVTIAFDDDLDLGLVRLRDAHDLPVAQLADAPPADGDPVCVIGQPGTRTPDGDATGYQPWTVTIGHIRGFRAGSRTGEQHLGRTKHDAWTYWGHSGSPLFDRDGKIVALHNSWDSTTAMRHAVTWEAITQFLAQH